MTNTIKEVMLAEKEAEKTVEKAAKKAIKIISDAKISSLKVISNKNRQTDQKQEKRIDEKEKELGKQKDGILRRGKTQTESLEKSANIKKAKEFVLKELEKQIQ